MERLAEAGRRLRRAAEARRRPLLLVAVIVLLLLYTVPGPMLRFWGLKRGQSRLPSELCLRERLAQWTHAVERFDATAERDVAPYIGNGVFGMVAEDDERLYIRTGRTLALPIDIRLVQTVSTRIAEEAFVVDYISGSVHRYQCAESGLEASYKYYAHRTMPYLFVQEIELYNPTDGAIDVDLRSIQVLDWPSLTEKTVELLQGDAVNRYRVQTGKVEAPGGNDLAFVVSVVSRILPAGLTLKSKDSTKYNSYSVIKYAGPFQSDKYDLRKVEIENGAIDSMKKVIEAAERSNLWDSHVNVWRQLWFTGFSISESKAEDAINGDKINATMYAVLSQVRSLEYEEGISQPQKSEILRSLAYAEGCYEGHHTLQAENLWKPLRSVQQINNVVRAWILTLEKQGCHNLIRAGASGVIQAMVLSFGSLRFSNQHLEFNMHPSDLHRDLIFRRLNYGNMTHINISAIVQEDDTASLYVALDRSDKNYFACDGGCLDSPMLLGPSRRRFPVKLTDPATAILYVTSDKQHMEDLRHAIHVKEVVVAPAHEHHVIALHRHGHAFGAISTFFWVSICLIIVTFHVFLCRIIMSEYCDPPDNKYRRLYVKP